MANYVDIVVSGCAPFFFSMKTGEQKCPDGSIVYVDAKCNHVKDYDRPLIWHISGEYEIEGGDYDGKTSFGFDVECNPCRPSIEKIYRNFFVFNTRTMTFTVRTSLKA